MDNLDSFHAGFSISSRQAAKLRKVESLSNRFRLLGFYTVTQNSAGWGETMQWLVLRAPQDQTLRFVRVPPDLDDKIYNAICTVLLNQCKLHPNRVDVLSNAISILSARYPQRAEKLLVKGARLEPNNPEWQQRLVFCLLRQIREAKSKQTRRRKASRAYEAGDAGLKLLKSPSALRCELLLALSEIALICCDVDSANRYLRLLKGSGGIATLYANDVEILECHKLLLQGRTKSAASKLGCIKHPYWRQPLLDFLPLLVRSGERNSVKDFLTKAKQTASDPNKALIQDWIREMAQGKVPQFCKIQ